jgi:CheY-like chemotaxis protein
MALILLIDDSDFTRELTGLMLETAGHELMGATNGIEGLKALMTRIPDCVITDMHMPGMDGQKFLLALRSRNIRVPVIMLTADMEEKTRDYCLELGAVDILHKPPSPEILLSAVINALESGI